MEYLIHFSSVFTSTFSKQSKICFHGANTENYAKYLDISLFIVSYETDSYANIPDIH